MTTDKKTLINSMNNLINHISVSQSNQEQIFHSLTRKDFEKIISNLDDSLPRLRLTTALLLGQLLLQHPQLQIKFCQAMGIPTSPSSKIVLNSNLSKLTQRYPQKIHIIFRLLKQQIPEEYLNGAQLIWFINPGENSPAIRFLTRPDLISVIAETPEVGTSKTISHNSSSSSTKGESAICFDPADCIMGILIKKDSRPIQGIQQQRASIDMINQIPSLRSQPPTTKQGKNYRQSFPTQVPRNSQNPQNLYSGTPTNKVTQQPRTLYLLEPKKQTEGNGMRYEARNTQKAYKDNKSYLNSSTGSMKNSQTYGHGPKTSMDLTMRQRMETDSFLMNRSMATEESNQTSEKQLQTPGIQLTQRHSYGNPRAPMTDRTYLFGRGKGKQDKQNTQYMGNRASFGGGAPKTGTNKGQNIKTITLGGRGCETTRERKPIRIMMNWQ